MKSKKKGSLELEDGTPDFQAMADMCMEMVFRMRIENLLYKIDRSMKDYHSKGHHCRYRVDLEAVRCSLLAWLEDFE